MLKNFSYKPLNQQDGGQTEMSPVCKKGMLGKLCCGLDEIIQKKMIFLDQSSGRWKRGEDDEYI